MTWREEDGWIIFDDGTRCPAIAGGEIMTIIVIAAVVVAAVATAASAYMSSQSQADQYEDVAEDFKAEAAVNTIEEEQAVDQAGAAYNSEKYRQDRLLASISPKYAAAGVVLGEGTSLEVELTSAREAEYNNQLARYGYDTKAWTANLDSRLNKYQAKRYQGIAQKTRDSALTSALVAGGTSLASSAGSVTGTIGADTKINPPKSSTSSLAVGAG